MNTTLKRRGRVAPRPLREQAMSRIRSNRLLNRVTTAPVMALAAVSWWQIARADAVLDWNAIAADTISTSVLAQI